MSSLWSWLTGRRQEAHDAALKEKYRSIVGEYGDIDKVEYINGVPFTPREIMEAEEEFRKYHGMD